MTQKQTLQKSVLIQSKKIPKSRHTIRSSQKRIQIFKKEIKQYIKDNNLNLNQKSDLIKLANYCDEL